jgi:hypothetical protein
VRGGGPTRGAAAAEARVVGGRLRDGAFHPNRLATTDHPGQALLRLPVFKDADPAEVSLLAFEIELAPDAGGAYLATLRGVVGPADALAAVQQGILEMMAADPADHRSLVSIIDGPENGNNDGVITPDEIESSGLIRSMLDPDVTLRSVDGALLSIGFQLHLKPCAEGRCVDAPPISPCHDRIRDGDETDVDCGGSCPLACAGARACLAPDDCQSGMCGGGGMCAAPSCTDGRTNWLETDVDCGGSCPRCDLGRRCLSNQDCESLRCGPAGTCLAW